MTERPVRSAAHHDCARGLDPPIMGNFITLGSDEEEFAHG